MLLLRKFLAGLCFVTATLAACFCVWSAFRESAALYLLCLIPELLLLWLGRAIYPWKVVLDKFEAELVENYINQEAALFTRLRQSVVGNRSDGDEIDTELSGWTDERVVTWATERGLDANTLLTGARALRVAQRELDKYSPTKLSRSERQVVLSQVEAQLKKVSHVVTALEYVGAPT